MTKPDSLSAPVSLTVNQRELALSIDINRANAELIQKTLQSNYAQQANISPLYTQNN